MLTFLREKTLVDEFRKLVGIMARLRADGGCEWDRAQTHESLRQYLVEEAHEVIDAIRGGTRIRCARNWGTFSCRSSSTPRSLPNMGSSTSPT